MKSPAHRDVQIDALRDAGNVRRADAIAVEEPLEIRLMQGRRCRGATTTAAPAGPFPSPCARRATTRSSRWDFSTAKGCCASRATSSTCGTCGPTGNVIRVTVRADLPLDLDAPEAQFLHHVELRRVRQGLHRGRDRERRRSAASSSDLVVRESVLRGLPDTLRASQAGFAETGGMHAVGLFTARGRACRQPRRRRPPQRHGQARRRRIDATAHCPGASASCCCRAARASS